MKHKNVNFLIFSIFIFIFSNKLLIICILSSIDSLIQKSDSQYNLSITQTDRLLPVERVKVQRKEQKDHQKLASVDKYISIKYIDLSKLRLKINNVTRFKSET